MATPADSAAFDVVKTSMNLMFAREEYVDDITDLEHGPMALATLQRWDKRDEGSLSVGDPAFGGGGTGGGTMPGAAIQVFSLGEQAMRPLRSFFTPGRPLVLTFGSFS